VLQRAIPELAWTIYPRSITTLKPAAATKLRALIVDRRRYRGAELDPAAFDEASLEKLRRYALLKSSSNPSSKSRQVIQRTRQNAVKKYAHKRARGACELCRAEAPFRNEKGAPYLECHHITELANEGADHPGHVIAVCPNCHRRAHHASDRANVKRRMKSRVATIERLASRNLKR
jgi:5-methylcytosine-specific restriction protein A